MVEEREPRQRAVGLFRFLEQVQAMKGRPVRDLSIYGTASHGGDVIWLHDLPHHSAISCALWEGAPAAGDPLLEVERVPRVEPPSLPELLHRWVIPPLDNPSAVPELRDEVWVPGGIDASGDAVDRLVQREEQPEIAEAWDRFLLEWRAWASAEHDAEPARQLYGRCFDVADSITARGDEYELVLGVGALAWAPGDHERVRRHVLTTPISVGRDEDTGSLSIAAASGAATLETDMVDPDRLGISPVSREDIRRAAADHEGSPLDREVIGSLARRLVNLMSARGQYLDEDNPPAVHPDPTIAYAPAIILRKRSQAGLVTILGDIATQLEDGEQVPDGILPLVDPNHSIEPTDPPDHRDAGAWVDVDGEPFLPLPVNDRQLRVIESVDRHSQVLVQGPPGTGKTHVAAALISHLLAQGKRVLVTAQTDRALKEVRQKLPIAIQPLSVAVVGAGREEMASLKVAVETIAQNAGEHDAAEAESIIAASLAEIEHLRGDRDRLRRLLVTARENETVNHDQRAYHGTLARIAESHAAEGERHGWLQDSVVIDDPEAPLPLPPSDLGRLRDLLIDAAIARDAAEALGDLPDIERVPDPDGFAELVTATSAALEGSAGHEHRRQHGAYEVVTQLPAEVRRGLRSRIDALADRADDLSRRREQWMNAALADVLDDRGTQWRSRRSQLGNLSDEVSPILERLGPALNIGVSVPDPLRLRPMAVAVLEHVRTGKVIKTDTAGTPKMSPFVGKVVRESAELFDVARVDGVPPTSERALQAVIDWLDGDAMIGALDRAWPEHVSIPREDTLRERLDWHLTEIEILDRLLTFADELVDESATLDELGIRHPDWTDLAQVRQLADVVDAADSAEALATTRQPLRELDSFLGEATRWEDAAPVATLLHTAANARDATAWRAAYRRLADLVAIQADIADRDQLIEQLASVQPKLADLLSATAHGEAWEQRVSEFAGAWDWVCVASWLRGQDATDVNALQAELTLIDGRLRRTIETLAATRAWTYAVAPDRIDGMARANLAQYSLAVRKLGKGTGKYATQYRADIREAMDRCRPSVPVWILPIYRLAEQLTVEPDMFDVVIVDEASQAGVEAAFLQFLAPKIVVIGDDKQVSPAGVGVDVQRMRDLTAQYLFDDPFRSTWSNTEASLFDLAKQRYGTPIALVEHRRCVPEIIGFSNRIAYEPDGIRLIPVRQYGADRLEPIKPVYLPDGYLGKNKTNPVEIEALIDQVAKCCADPAYDGLTFGVISLLGGGQSKAIQGALLDLIGPEQWAARDLRCGEAPDFQGSERDVMFLSMVAAPAAGTRLSALVRDMHVQRFNVAGSRAKDQMWIFHSMSMNELTNTEDMRFALLDYCYGVSNRAHTDIEGIPSTPVPDDHRVEPFDSLFEQRVFNRIHDRGYTIVPQYPVEGYLLDLVIVGQKGKLAIECDGDFWHGPEQYDADLARQRDLERCGWDIFRIRESAFYLDTAAVLADLWQTLEERDIHPHGWLAQPDQASDDAEAEIPVDVPPVNDPGLQEPIRERQTFPADPEPDPVSPANRAVGTAPNLDEITLHPPGPWSDAEPRQTPLIPPELPADMQPRLVTHERIEAAATAESSLPAVDDDSSNAQPSVAILGEQPSAVGTPDTDPDGPPAQAAASDTMRVIDGFATYQAFDGETIHPDAADPQQLRDGILAIVEVEGPVLGDRLRRAYVLASGGQRVGKQIGRILNRGIAEAVRDGTIVVDKPTDVTGIKERTYRTPTQPIAKPRELGPRSFEQVPPLELAAALTIDRALGRTKSAAFRRLLAHYGLSRLTDNVEKILLTAWELEGPE